MTERDIWQAVDLLIRAHGERAGMVAARHAAALIDRGDREDQAVWTRITLALAAWQSDAPARGQRRH